MSGNKRKKSIAGVAIEDGLPDHLHYHGNAPKQNSQEFSLLLLFHLFQDNGITATGFIALMMTIIAV